ncbi:hypothetical protein SP40_87 [Salmonella phage 40]|nr:hypothetical protein SP40_87 [Salmonella phage 40]
MSNSVFVIYDTVDKFLWNSGAKVGWIKSGAAKNAWNLVNSSWNGKKYFDNQTRYVIVELSGEHVGKFLEEKNNVAE